MLALPQLVRTALRKPVLSTTERMLAQAGLYRVEIDCPIGFFAQMSGLITLLRMCERRRLKPDVALTSKLYAEPQRGRNFLSYYFDGPEYSRAQRRLARLLPVRRERDFSFLPGWARNDYPALSEALQLFGRYYRVKQDIVDEVQAFTREHFQPASTLGIHFRGTDKLQTDSTAVGYEYVAQLVRGCLRAYPGLSRVFVATDEPDFILFIGREFPGMKVVAPRDHVPATGSTAIHISNHGSGYLKGRDALVNCLLLAECDVLLKTMSNLSGWSTVFRPSLPTFLLNRPVGAGVETLGFPEQEMVQREWFADKLLTAD